MLLQACWSHSREEELFLLYKLSFSMSNSPSPYSLPNVVATCSEITVFKSQ